MKIKKPTKTTLVDQIFKLVETRVVRNRETAEDGKRDSSYWYGREDEASFILSRIRELLRKEGDA